jgi:hypothetical protein
MGHATIQMTERYAHLSPETRKQAVAVLDVPFASARDLDATRLEGAANQPRSRPENVEAAGIEAAA